MTKDALRAIRTREHRYPASSGYIPDKRKPPSEPGFTRGFYLCPREDLNLHALYGH